MNYQIKLDEDFIIYDLREEEFFVENPVLDLEINKIGTLKFNIYPDHPYFDRLYKLTSRIEVKRNDKVLFRGRIISDEQGIYNNKEIECESTLSFLNDSIVSPGSFSGSPEEFFRFILENHNSQVTENQKLKIGNVTIKDNNDYISRSWNDYLNSLDMLNNRGIDLLGGYIVERYENDGTYIDWLEDFDKICDQGIEMGENLIDLLSKNDASNTYTVVFPFGAEIEKEDGTKERVTISSVNEGKNYLIDEESYKKYGWIVAPVSETTWSDVTVPENLKSKGLDYLHKTAKQLLNSFELTSLDLSSLDVHIESFFIYKYVRFKSDIHNVNKLFLINKISIPLDQPENILITIGDSKNTLTSVELGNKKNIDTIIDRVGTIEADYVTNKNITQIVNETVSDNSIIKQLPDKITQEVSQQTTIIKSDVSNLTISSNNNYQELIDKLNNMASKEEITEILNKVDKIQTANADITKIVETIQVNGIDKVVTETGVTIDISGMTIDQTTAMVKLLLNANGQMILDKSDGSTLLFAGYDPKTGETIVSSKNMTVWQYLNAPRLRLEAYENPTHGPSAGLFPMGGGN